MSDVRPIQKLLVANRGEIALRILRAAHEMGIRTVAVYSDADRTALHVRGAYEAVRLGPPAPSASYLDTEAVLAAAKQTGADAIHPGYGFLAENAGFAEAVEAAGITFVGPPPAAMRAMGDKLSARRTVMARNVPVVPGAELPEDADERRTLATARALGFPVLVKAAFGGGGKGMRLVEAEGDLIEAVARASSEAVTAFGDGTVYLERAVQGPRHIEIQVIADQHGHTRALGERECSVQRRHQKVVEECPSPAVSPELRAEMEAAAIAAAEACAYTSAGTVEFLLGADGSFYFLEMNTRIQVEHPITELCYGVDLVREQIRVAEGRELSLPPPPLLPRGHAIEARITAEDADHGFLPSTGRIRSVQMPGGPGIRVDGHVYAGQEITLHYDNLLVKLVAHAEDRPTAIARLRRALYETRIGGLTTNIPFILRVLDDEGFAAGDYDTSIVSRLPAQEPTADTDLLPVVAAALALHRRVPKTAIPESGPTTTALSPWVLADRGWSR